MTALYCAPQKQDEKQDEKVALLAQSEEVSLPVAFALVQKTETYQDKTGKTKQRDPGSKTPIKP